jgi:hypothetical protein
MSAKVGCSDPLMMVDRVWVSGWAIDWIWAGGLG